jgi:hypothetical protein
MPVPWVTRWTEERTDAVFGIAKVLDRRTGQEVEMVVYPDEQPADRDERGVMWFREHNDKVGQGEPEWSQVASARQRRAMRGRCQVCGIKLPNGRTTWLLPAIEVACLAAEGVLNKKGALTQTPPVCDSCAEIAPTICPALRQTGAGVAKVSSYRVWGYGGETAWVEDGQLRRAQWEEIGVNDDANLRRMVAKQLLVTFDSWRLVGMYEEGELMLFDEASRVTT